MHTVMSRSNNLFCAALCATGLSVAFSTATNKCTYISSFLPAKVLFPNSTLYQASKASYTFTEEQLNPQCILAPSSSQDVSRIVQTLGAAKSLVPFAIRGGGHSPIAGAANADNGITIDLRSMDGIALSSDKRVVSVGAGASWGDVYSALLSQNLSVVGGRATGVGVGGFLTGGGLSYYGPRLGFGCDNVVNMEVVLASGQIVNANSTSHSDLFAALKDGSNNFGVVTRFDLKTVQQGQFWGGAIEYPSSAISQQLAAFTKFKQPQNFDPYAEVENSYVYSSATESTFSSNEMFYTKPTVNASALRPFFEIQSQLVNTMRISDIYNFSVELSAFQPENINGMYATVTFEISPTILSNVYESWNATIPRVASVSNLTYSLSFQSVPAYVPGNSMGLSGPEGESDPSRSLVLCLLASFWAEPSDSATMKVVNQRLISKIQELARQEGLLHDYQYLNYAASFQDPIGSYGEVEKEKLLAVSRRYDPNQVFQKRVSGNFKLL